jgi:hypothetical protein
MSQITAPDFQMDRHTFRVQQNRFTGTQLLDPLAQAKSLQQQRTKPPQRAPGAMAVTVAIPLTGELEQGACLLG